MKVTDVPTERTAYLFIIFKILLLMFVGYTFKVMARNANEAKHAPLIAAARASMPPVKPPLEAHADCHVVFDRVKALRPVGEDGVNLSEEELHAALRLIFGTSHPLPMRMVDQICRKHVPEGKERQYSFGAFAGIVAALKGLNLWT
jgi:hypothetical protein